MAGGGDVSRGWVRPWARSGRGRDAPPSPRSRRFHGRDGARLGGHWEASPAGLQSRHGRRHAASPRHISFPLKAGRGSQSSSPTGERREALRGCTAGPQREAQIHAEILLSGRCVGSNSPVQTGISKLLCIDYIYPAPLSAPRPAARVPPAAAAPPRPGPGVASGSGYNSRGKRQ